jgi:hypothetical protein
MMMWCGRKISAVTPHAHQHPCQSSQSISMAHLCWPEFVIIDVKAADCPFQIEEARVMILVFVPPACQ